MSRRGQVWTREEDYQLAQEFSAGADLAALVVKLDRTPWGVIARLVALGLLAARGDWYHRVEVEPWTGYQEIKRVQKQTQELGQ